jgi:hypothetical protein
MAEIARSLPLADVPASVTVFVALITGVTGVLGGLISASRQAQATMISADRQAEATITTAETQAHATAETAREERFTTWQMHKRVVYADFLTAAHAASENPGGTGVYDEFIAQANRVRVTASEDLRELLKDHLDNAGAITGEPLLGKILEAMGKDIRVGSPAD